MKKSKIAYQDLYNINVFFIDDPKLQCAYDREHGLVLYEGRSLSNSALLGNNNLNYF